MITAWQIYWVMQLDAIGMLFFVFGLLSVIAAAIAAMIRLCEEIEAAGKTAKMLVAFGAACMVIAAFIPSTKTAAAMVVIPAVANNEAIQREAGDLYGIAKNALRELAKPDKAAEESE